MYITVNQRTCKIWGRRRTDLLELAIGTGKRGIVWNMRKSAVKSRLDERNPG